MFANYLVKKSILPCYDFIYFCITNMAEYCIAVSLCAETISMLLKISQKKIH